MIYLSTYKVTFDVLSEQACVCYSIMLRLRPPVLGLCSWSCLNLLNLCGGETEAPKPERNVRQFSMSAAKVKLPPDARLYEDQNLSCTQKGKTKINTDRVAINQLKAYLGQMSPELVKRTLTDNNSQLTKITQNLYVTSLGGLKEMNLKRRKVNLLLNASIDLPMVDMGNVETIRVPITEKEPDSVSLYASDVADLIQENYCKDGQTLIYCHDGNRNSIALSTGNFQVHTHNCSLSQ